MNRTRLLTMAALAAMTLAVPARAADEALPKAETILDKFVEATGGKAAYEKHTSSSAKMSMEFVGKGIKGTGTQLADSSNNLVQSITIENIGKLDQGAVDGVIWESNPMTGPRVLSGDEKTERLRDTRFNAPVQWRDIWKSVATEGSEAVSGEECYKVVLTPASGKPVTNWYSKKTGLLVKEVRTVATQMGELPVEFYPKDYKEFDGIMMPTRLTQMAMGAEILITTDEVKFNVPVKKEMFAPPAEIKKLMAK